MIIKTSIKSYTKISDPVKIASKSQNMGFSEDLILTSNF